MGKPAPWACRPRARRGSVRHAVLVAAGCDRSDHRSARDPATLVNADKPPVFMIRRVPHASLVVSSGPRNDKPHRRAAEDAERRVSPRSTRRGTEREVDATRRNAKRQRQHGHRATFPHQERSPGPCGRGFLVCACRTTGRDSSRVLGPVAVVGLGPPFCVAPISEYSVPVAHEADIAGDATTLGLIQEGERFFFETVISVAKSKHQMVIPTDPANLDQLCRGGGF